MKYLTPLLPLLLLLLPSTSAHAQKLDGDWKLVARANGKPCEVDVLLSFGEKGQGVTFKYGTQAEGCKTYDDDYAFWDITKEDVQTRTGKRKMKMINFRDAEGADPDNNWILIEYEGDFMYVQADVVDEDTTKPKRLIFRRIETGK